MAQSRDPYLRLRPEPAIPDTELCQCPDSPPVALQDHLSSVPLACVRCNGEVPPKRLGFDEDLSGALRRGAPFIVHCILCGWIQASMRAGLALS